LLPFLMMICIFLSLKYSFYKISYNYSANLNYFYKFHSIVDKICKN
jgi:hypothetical protein